MKVFISWSGEQSRRIAEVLSNWLPKANHSVRPFYSLDDIAKGTRWQSELPPSKLGGIFVKEQT